MSDTCTRTAPDPAEIRGECPLCGAPVITVLVYTEGKGYYVVWTCHEALAEQPTCTYSCLL